jgi:enterobacterial common antigen flippase
MSSKNSYSKILKASSVMGSAAGINLLLGMLRVKFAAVLIGTAGIGLNASFGALQSVVGSVAGLGIRSSAVREIAVAVGKNDEQAIGRAVLTLRRLCWFTGLLGMAVMVIFSPVLSLLTFGDKGYTLDIAALGVVILFGNLSGGQMALIQGMRRIGDIARADIIGAMFGTVAAIAFYSTLGLRGIVPALLAVSAFRLALSWHFARKVPVPKVNMTFRRTLAEGNSMVRLGLVFMTSGLMGTAVTYITIALITQYEGIQAVGIYSAAFALSGMFVNFVLGAMAADYYPRLTAVAHDHAAMNRMVNEQTEIGVLLALPGLLATLALSPWILQLFYTREFLGSVELLHWFILGCMGRVISWPLGFVMLALGRGRWFLLTETSFNILHVALVALGLKHYGVEGVAIAFVVMYFGYISAVYSVSHRLIGFKWSAECTRLGLLALSILAVAFSASRLAPIWPATWIGLSLTLIASVLCLRGLVTRVGSEHRIVRAITRLPGGKLLLMTN